MNTTQRRKAAVAIAVLTAIVLSIVPGTSEAQAVLPLEACPTCMALPAPRALDGWPDPVNDSLGSVATASVTFAGATLLSNDRGAGLRIVAVGPASTGGGTITGTDPFLFTFAPGFRGEDVFTYTVSDAAGQMAVALVRVVAVGDTIPPTVSLTSPAPGDVSGVVVVSASASDDVGVAGVRVFDGATQIGAELTVAPFQVNWDTSLVTEGAHSLTAVARDLAGNVATSAAVAVNVVRPPPAPVTSPTVLTTRTSNGLGTRRVIVSTTTGAVLLALVGSDGPAASNAQSVTISGAGLTWTRVRRAAAQFGVSEIWTATAAGPLTDMTVTSTPAVGGYYQSLTVIGFSNSSGVGASNVGSAPTGAPTVSLVTQGGSSLVYAVGNDWDRAIPRVLPAGQTKVREFLTPLGDTMWVQRATSPIAAAGTNVTLSVISPTTDQWNFAIVEVKAGSAVPVPPPPPPPPPPAPSGPVLQLSFNETSGSVALDSSGHGNNGTIAGAARVAGQYGGGLGFDGVDDWVTIADAPALDLTGAMTLEAWVRMTSIDGWETVALKERGVGALSYGLYAADGTPALGGVDGPAGYVSINGVDHGVRRAAGLPTGTWVHLAITYDGSAQRLYVDAVEVASRAQTGAIGTSNGPLRIGGNGAWTGEFFRGVIDEVRVYNRALSAAEIATDRGTPIP